MPIDSVKDSNYTKLYLKTISPSVYINSCLDELSECNINIFSFLIYQTSIFLSPYINLIGEGRYYWTILLDIYIFLYKITLNSLNLACNLVGVLIS